MSEPKVLHQWASSTEDSEFRVVSGPYERFVERRYYQTDAWHEVKSSSGLAREILRLSAELARARTKGRLEGMREIEQAAWKEFAGQDPAWTEVSALMNRLIAAAERGLAGGKEGGGE